MQRKKRNADKSREMQWNLYQCREMQKECKEMQRDAERNAEKCQGMQRNVEK